MPRTVFTDNVSVLLAAWANLVFNHNHRGLDQDGSAPNITIDDLDPTIKNLLGDLSGMQSQIGSLFLNDRTKVNPFGGTGREGAYTGGFNLDRPVYEFTSFTINTGTNIQVTRGLTRIKCTGDVLINGSLTAVPIQPFGMGKAWFNTGGQAYNIGANFLGSAGGETVDHTNLSGLQVIRDRGGFGGGAIIFEVLGNIIINGTIAANGGNAGVSTILSGNPVLGGSGAGSAGSVTLQTFGTLQINGTIDLIGGRGGDGYGTNAAGGGGGAGGVFSALAGAINRLPNSVNVSGGSPGTSLGAGSQLGAGGGGFGGQGGNSKSAGQAGIIQEQTITGSFSYI